MAKEKILVVDDEEDIRSLFAKKLEVNGFEADTVGSMEDLT